MRKLLSIISLLFTQLTFAAATPELHCTPLTIKSENKEIVLPGPSEARATKIYVFKNLTTHSIWLDHPVLHPSVGMGWSSYVRVGNAAALWVNRKNFNVNCAVIKPGKVEYLDCAKAVSVCEPKEVKVSPARKGTFWLVEDKSVEGVLKVLAKVK